MADVEQPTNPPTAGPSTIGRLLIAGFMGLVVACECLFAYFWLPSAEQVAARAEQISKQAQSDGPESEEDKEAEKALAIEVDLGKFTVTNHRLSTEATFRIDFHLFGTVDEEQQGEFQEIFARNEHRFRDHVIVEVRNSEISDLTDAGLGLIKRRILEKSNALFGKPLLKSVVFAEYSFVEL